ncbi:MAG: metallophosphoesterase [Deltaproteobacteria bacterium]|nr:metallophosphoesterase [Deltaproteobacteria bacterium]MBW2253594.1 metallophosphoesterase [Deltaproteobacteria bacterium]
MIGWNRPVVVEEIRDDCAIWFISDLHLGDGTPSDAFFGKDQQLIALLEQVEKQEALLVIGGDAVDFHQAWSFTRILRAHQELFGALSRLARNGRLIYVTGNHDYDLTLYRELLDFRVCDELQIGDSILVQHGYQYDPFLQKDLERGHSSTKIHHLVERYLNTWIRIPLSEFYTLGNRMMFWIVYQIALFTRAYAQFARLLGYQASADAAMRRLDFWARSNMGDPMCIFQPIMKRLRTDRWKYIVCGHSHLPGIVRQGGRAYVNSGSWTFASSHYLTWDGRQFSCRDWITGRVFDDDLYKPLVDGTIDEKDFWQWWSENYMGLLRFREGEEQRGRLRGWESYIRDYQNLSHFQLTPIHPGMRELAPPRQSDTEEKSAK